MSQLLSPAAQAVRDAVLATYADNIPKDDDLWALERASTVAALRAAADQVITKNRLVALDTERSAESRLLLVWVRDQIRAIAAELGGAG